MQRRLLRLRRTHLPLLTQSVPTPAPCAAASSAAVSCILVVVGTIVFRSAQLVAAAGDPFAHVKAFNLSWDALGALPLVILGFACHTNVRSVLQKRRLHAVGLLRINRRALGCLL